MAKTSSENFHKWARWYREFAVLGSEAERASRMALAERLEQIAKDHERQSASRPADEALKATPFSRIA
jgi:hypothetical protein